MKRYLFIFQIFLCILLSISEHVLAESSIETNKCVPPETCRNTENTITVHAGDSICTFSDGKIYFADKDNDHYTCPQGAVLSQATLSNICNIGEKINWITFNPSLDPDECVNSALSCNFKGEIIKSSTIETTACVVKKERTFKCE